MTSCARLVGDYRLSGAPGERRAQVKLIPRWISPGIQQSFKRDLYRMGEGRGIGKTINMNRGLTDLVSYWKRF